MLPLCRIKCGSKNGGLTAAILEERKLEFGGEGVRRIWT